MSPIKPKSAELSPLGNAYLLAGLAGVGMFGFLLAHVTGRMAMVPTLIGAAGLAFRWHSAPLLFLASVCLGHIYLNWVHGPFFYSTWPDLGLCAAGLVYVIAHYRLIGLTAEIFPADTGRTGDKPPPRAEKAWHLEIMSTLLVAATVTAGAFGLWLGLSAVRAPWQTEPIQWRVGLLAWVLLGSWVVAAAVLGHLGWRRLSRMEASVFLQDALWHETRREQRRINRWRAWALRRR
jgi:hypothetical protein